MSEKQGDLLEWARENAKKEAENKRLEQLTREREEDEEEIRKLHQYGKGIIKPEKEGGSNIPERTIARTNHELWMDRDHEKAIDEDKFRKTSAEFWKKHPKKPK